MDILNFCTEQNATKILNFITAIKVTSKEDMNRVSDIAKSLINRIDQGDQYLIPIVELMLENVEKWEDQELKRMSIEQPDEVAIVRYLIDAQKLSISQLSKEISMQRTVLSEILNRKNSRRFTRDQLERLAKYFDIYISVFFN